MKKTVSVVYTVFVVAALLCVIAFFGWKTYQSRAVRISDFVARTDDYTRRLSESLEDNRDVDTEVAIAEKLMAEDPSLVAIQVYSHDDGLRLSVVKSVAGEFTRTPIADSERFDGFPARYRYHKVSQLMRIPDMQGLEATYISATLSGAEIRNNLMIILITVAGLFAITLVLILIKPGNRIVSEDDEKDDEQVYESEDYSLPGEFRDDHPSLDSSGGGAPESLPDDDFSLPDFDEADRLDDNDLLGSSNPEFGDTLELDDDFDLPNLDDFPVDSAGLDSSSGGDIVGRLELELERAASFNQDLSLLIFSGTSNTEELIRSTYTYEDLVFPMDNGKTAVIEINKDLDTSLAMTEEFIRECIDSSGNRGMRAGIASRNGRLIGAERLFSEAENSLRKTDESKNIVAFRSDPEKYREFLKNQEN